MNNDLSDYIVCISISQSISIEANQLYSDTINISIPDKYKYLCSYIKNSGSKWFYAIGCSTDINNSTISYYIKNTYNGTDTGNPMINIICIRDL